MKYFIRPILPDVGETQEVSEAEYNEIIRARKLAWDTLLVKEHFSYVVRSFVLLENKINEIETKANKDSDDNSHEFFGKLCNGSFFRENIHILNLLAINLFTTYKSYLELFDYQGKNRKREAFLAETTVRQALEKIKETHHKKDDILCLFFMTLRNYAQHHARPVIAIPTEINGKVKIDLGVNLESIFGILTDKRLNKLNIPDPISCLKSYIEGNFPYLNFGEDDKKFKIRLLIKKYILLLKKVNDDFMIKSELKLQEAKNMLNQKVKDYCHDDSPELAFEIYKLNNGDNKLERFDVSLRLFNDWETELEKYSNLDPYFN